MARPTKAKPKGNGAEFVENGILDRGKPVVLNIAGVADTAIANNRAIRVQMRVFFRANGIPFVNVFQRDIPGPILAGAAFEIPAAEAPSFIPQHKTVHSFRILAWDTTPGQSPNKVKGVRSHVVRLRVK